METNKVQITLAITTYNRTKFLYESFIRVINDERINEIVIVDDCSNIEIFNEVANFCKSFDKIKLHRNEKNLDCYKNKKRAIELSTNKWVIILDSDNIIDSDYVDCCDKLLKDGVSENRVYQPCFAKPHFDFTKYSGELITRFNVHKHIQDSTFQTMLNAMNYFVNRDEYLKVWRNAIDPVTCDSIYHNTNWLEQGNTIYVVPNMVYEHRVHDGSHYKNNVQRTPSGLYNEIIKRLKSI